MFCTLIACFLILSLESLFWFFFFFFFVSQFICFQQIEKSSSFLFPDFFFSFFHFEFQSGSFLLNLRGKGWWRGTGYFSDPADESSWLGGGMSAWPVGCTKVAAAEWKENKSRKSRKKLKISAQARERRKNLGRKRASLCECCKNIQTTTKKVRRDEKKSS